jgi:hypothetical protein
MEQGTKLIVTKDGVFPYDDEWKSKKKRVLSAFTGQRYIIPGT